MPLRARVTPGWFQTWRKAQAAGERREAARSQSFWMAGGILLVRLPPRSGSMTTTPRPLPAAYSRPSRPAWYCSSMKLYWIWQNDQG